MAEWPLMRGNLAAQDVDALVSYLRQDGEARLTQGSEVRAFEREWSAWLGAEHSVFVNSGSSANLLTMAALRHLRGPGEVVVPTLTWSSDIASVLHAGLRPVFVDIDPRSLGMDTRAVLDRLGPRTRAVFLTHVLGFCGLDRALLEGLERAGVPLVANDRVDLAALAGCDMVHVGQEDLPHDLVSRIAPAVDVGVSTHDLPQLERALAARPRYVAYGPVFATTTKKDPDPVVGLEGLRQAAELARRARIPLVAIGGITLERAPEVGRVTPLAAVIGDVFSGGASDASITARARAIGVALAGSPRMVEAVS